MNKLTSARPIYLAILLILVELRAGETRSQARQTLKEERMQINANSFASES